VIRGLGAVLMPHSPRDWSFALVDRLARLGWTRMGSPGIYGERNP